MFTRFVGPTACLLTLLAPRALADERIAPIAAEDFDRLLAAVKPLRGESPWREIGRASCRERV